MIAELLQANKHLKCGNDKRADRSDRLNAALMDVSSLRWSSGSFRV